MHLVHTLGYTHEDARELVDILLDPSSACEICGITNRILKALYRRNFGFPSGTLESNRRLTPDNLKPGQRHVLENTRLLCRPCNVYRGANRRTDEQVLAWARRWWTKRLPPKFLGWLR